MPEAVRRRRGLTIQAEYEIPPWIQGDVVAE